MLIQSFLLRLSLVQEISLDPLPAWASCGWRYVEGQWQVHWHDCCLTVRLSSHPAHLMGLHQAYGLLWSSQSIAGKLVLPVLARTCWHVTYSYKTHGYCAVLVLLAGELFQAVPALALHTSARVLVCPLLGFHVLALLVAASSFLVHFVGRPCLCCNLPLYIHCAVALPCQVAMLSANYMKSRLSQHYNIYYQSKTGQSAGISWQYLLVYFVSVIHTEVGLALVRLFEVHPVQCYIKALYLTNLPGTGHFSWSLRFWWYQFLVSPSVILSMFLEILQAWWRTSSSWTQLLSRRRQESIPLTLPSACRTMVCGPAVV